MTPRVKVRSFYNQSFLTVVLVHVANSDDWMPERIRRLPKKIPPLKRFSLCKNVDGLCRHGDNCTYAHSKVEQDSWNAQLAESEDDSMSEGEFLYPIVPQSLYSCACRSTCSIQVDVGINQTTAENDTPGEEIFPL